MTAWLRHKLSWSTDTQSRRERLGIGAVGLAAVGLAWMGRGLSAWQQLLLWALLVLALALLARRGWLKLFGPVFFFDLIRSARRQRSFFNRVLYGGSLLVLVCWIYIMWLGQHNDVVIRADEMAGFAASFEKFKTVPPVMFRVPEPVTVRPLVRANDEIPRCRREKKLRPEPMHRHHDHHPGYADRE